MPRWRSGLYRLLAHFRLVLFCLASAGVISGSARGEIIFQDSFNGPAGSVTNSLPWIDVQGDGWQARSPTELEVDGRGHLFNALANSGASAGVPLIPIGPHGSMTIAATLELPAGSSEWIGFGFGNANQFLAGAGSASGPWLQIHGTGSVTLYGGSGQNNGVTAPTAFTNTGGPVRLFLTYDAFQTNASVGILSTGATNMIFQYVPVTNTLASILARYLIFQFSTNTASPSARWASDVTVDWLPRPAPMLTLPEPVSQVVQVGAPNGNDVQLIQSALNLATSSSNALEIRFSAGATYLITNSSLVSNIPLTLSRATNVLVNGNGCKILVTNPRIGFLNVASCSNVIVQGFSVDYDPLPFTQGVVTHNFYTATNGPKESAIEFLVDAGYPAPTNANYIDASAVSSAERWGTIMDPARPGRGADNRHTIYIYNGVTQTNANGAFKVRMPFSLQTQTVQPGDIWCMVSRWNGSMVFNTHNSTRVTFLNDTNYAGAAASYVGTYSSLVNEINCQVLIGPSPARATAPRVKSSNADGGLFVESRIGPWVQGCNFTGLSDDLANATVNPFVITNVPAQPANTFSVWSYNNGASPGSLVPYQVMVGDSFVFYNASNGAIFDRAQVTAVNLPQVTFDHTIANVVPGTLQTNTLLFNISLNTSAVYLDNHFSNSRIHGIYCRADNMLIAHNTINGMGLSAISAFPALGLSTPNSLVPTNVVIMDNLLFDCSYSYESINNMIPTQEPAYALIDLHKTVNASDFSPTGFDISGIRILNNAFLDWRRAPLSLHNATDVIIAGNYFGPPLTSDGLVPLSTDMIADLWASDYPNIRITNNVNASALPESQTIQQDGTFVSGAGGFQSLLAPQLTLSVSGGGGVVSWVNPVPGFVLQQASTLDKQNTWQDVTNPVYIAGPSNTVSLTFPSGVPAGFYRTRQR